MHRVGASCIFRGTQMSGGPVGKPRALLQCASCRFGALYCVPFCAGMAAAGTLSPATALLGAAFWLTLGMAIEVTNRLADRVEDAANRPERTALCETVGWDLLARVQLLLWGLVVLATAVWLARAPNALLLLLLVSGAGFGIAYSRGPRLARHRLLVFVVLSGTFVGPFCEIQKGASVGRNCRIQSHSFICELVTIGDDCFIGHGVMFVNDLFKDGGPARGDRSKYKATKVGNRVSIGSNCTILPVEIADGTVIGAGAVVVDDITQPGVYAGNPARRLRALPG